MMKDQTSKRIKEFVQNLSKVLVLLRKTMTEERKNLDDESRYIYKIVKK